jgi:hypothetical protein
MGDRITLATVPDRTTAELLEEVLHDGGIEDVELKSHVGMVYVPRPNAVEYEVRVWDVDEAVAKKILADFEEDSGQAAASQSDEALGSETRARHARWAGREGPPLIDDDKLPDRRKRWVFIVAMLFVLLWVAPLLWSALLIVVTFVRGLF